jgi:hypothetical protein
MLTPPPPTPSPLSHLDRPTCSSVQKHKQPRAAHEATQRNAQNVATLSSRRATRPAGQFRVSSVMPRRPSWRYDIIWVRETRATARTGCCARNACLRGWVPGRFIS